jgi:hypothetical protein
MLRRDIMLPFSALSHESILESLGQVPMTKRLFGTARCCCPRHPGHNPSVMHVVSLTSREPVLAVASQVSVEQHIQYQTQYLVTGGGGWASAYSCTTHILSLRHSVRRQQPASRSQDPRGILMSKPYQTPRNTTTYLTCRCNPLTHIFLCSAFLDSPARPV